MIRKIVHEVSRITDTFRKQEKTVPVPSVHAVCGPDDHVRCGPEQFCYLDCRDARACPSCIQVKSGYSSGQVLSNRLTFFHVSIAAKVIPAFLFHVIKILKSITKRIVPQSAKV